MYENLFKIAIILSFTLSLFLSGCQNTSGPATAPAINLSETAIVDGYLSAIDLVFNTSPEMNKGLKYLAIDTSTLTNLNEVERTNLIEGLNTYNLEILNASFEELQQQGLVSDTVFENGIFLKIEDAPFVNGQIQITPSKWHSTTYAAGLSKVILTLNANNTWDITDSGIAWKQ